MAFSFGTGMLSTDPRKGGSRPTGGSIHAAQGVDTSVLITGNKSDGTIGFGDPSAFTGGLFQKPTIAPAPDFEKQSGYGMEKTAAETEKLTESRGVADTHENLGSLAVDFRADEQAKTDAGEQTTTQQRATKILDTRAADEHKRTILDPAAEEQAKFRAESLRAKNLIHASSNSVKSVKGQMKSVRNTGIISRGGASPSTSPTAGLFNINKGTDIFGKADRSGGKQIIGPNINAMMLEAKRVNSANHDIGALAATGVHAGLPGVQGKSTADQANAQAAGGRASPAQMAQAMSSATARGTPNKGN